MQYINDQLYPDVFLGKRDYRDVIPPSTGVVYNLGVCMNVSENVGRLFQLCYTSIRDVCKQYADH